MATENSIPGQAAGDEVAQSGTTSTSDGGDTWMKLAKDAYKRSTSYYENNYRKNIEDGLRMFNSQHARDSKYNSEAYKFRSRIFRPKTRSVIRKHEAAAAMAFFSNPDVLSIDPVNEDDQMQVASAGITKELMQYRLTKSIPWFITVLGAFQDAMSVGICCSFQYWDYRSHKEKEKKSADLFGTPIEIEVENEVVDVDKPCCEIFPVNHIRFDPAAKWYDVVNTSPYIILEMPMYLRDVLDRMENGYGKDNTPWKNLSEEVILSARITDTDPVQQARDGKKEDPNIQKSTVNEFDVVMVHLNFIKTEDGCYTYYTLKDLHLLSEPVELEEAFLHGEIPVTIGFCVLETHQTMPKGLAQLGAQLQNETNEVVNQRLDNVKYVLNKRSLVRRGANVDVDSMLRNVPGGITMVNDVEKDVREVNWPDVTSSSFQEQDRLNTDFDDLEGGGMNSGSVATNRKLNETVGGMRLMAQGANSLTEYTLRTFTETWVIPTLRQLVLLEQYYESDSTVLAIAAQRAGMWQHFRQSPDLDKLLQQELTVNVNVGMGATDPQQRMQAFIQATGAYAQVAQMAQAMPDMNLEEYRKEIFSLAGFRHYKQFFTQTDPNVALAQKLMQNAQGMAGKIIDQHKERIQRRERQLDEKDHALNDQMAAAQREFQIESQKAQREFMLDAQRQHQEMIQAEREAVMQQRMDIDNHIHEKNLADQKARDEAALAMFNARMDAMLAKFESATKMAIEKQEAEQKMRLMAKTSAKKQADGSWEITRH